jgi:hypothetical protein
MFRRLSLPVACLAFLVPLVQACFSGNPGFLGDCTDPDPSRLYRYTCDGDTLVMTSYRRGANGAHCEEDTSRNVCGSTDGACVAVRGGDAFCRGQCATDADCEASAYCSVQLQLSDRRSACLPYIKEHESCEFDPDHCAPGLKCVAGTAGPDAGDASTPNDAGAADASDIDAATQSAWSAPTCEHP